MKMLAKLGLALVFVLSFALPHGTTFAKTDTVKLVIDGVEVAGYEQPFISHDQVLIPVENLFNAAGYKVTKDNSGKLSVTNTYLTVDFNASANTINVNGKKVDTEFPLTLQNAGNYITSDFLATLEGFNVEVSEDKKTVNVKTNRVDTAAFLTKTAALNLKSSSLNLTLESLIAPAANAQLGKVQLDNIQDPKSSYKHITFPTVDTEGKVTVEEIEEYSTKDGDFKKFGDVWVKLTAPVISIEATKLTDAKKVNTTVEAAKEVTEATPVTEEPKDLTKAATPLQLDSLATLALLQKFTKGIHIFEYKDAYIMTQTLTPTEASELKSVLTGLLSGEVNTEAVKTEETTIETTKEEATTEDTKVEETATKIVNTEEKATDKKTTEEAKTDETETESTKTEDAKTDETTTEEAKTVFVIITFNNFNSVKGITVPADVIKNAISQEDFLKALEAKKVEEAKKAEDVKK
ncbi:hypothetical protein FQ087_11985 [Sporosarcina sp. ANT_H38]|uniref:stalk domain-containing protein n=1 Tax=Sporosarcina sp. ANT_H38 TaxID=2597358 RepID=UPI0011F3983A|nr:stalk domain-containing protein [Sporosarcina sp. ANT_H38]KAA0966898.1 hypothetical protein FQ087_11985 [Sporosarcina sp. ANT_H38]